MKVSAPSKIAAINQSQTAELYNADATVLVVTNDPEIRKDMRELLEPFPVKILWARGVEEVKKAVSRERISLCLCGFWLVDGTYRDVVSFLRLQRTAIPAVIVCSPSCPNESLAALNISALNFICHPYRTSDMEKTLQSAAGVRLRLPSPVAPLTVPEPAALREAS